MARRLSFFLFLVLFSCENKTPLFLSDYLNLDDDIEQILFENKPGLYASFKRDIMLLFSASSNKDGFAFNAVDPDLKVTVSSLGTVSTKESLTTTREEPKKQGAWSDSSEKISSLPSAQAGAETDKNGLSFEKSTLAKTLFNRFDFMGAIESFDKEHSYDALYYRGMSYYQLMSNDSYSKEERRGYRIKAIEDLKRVSEEYHNDNEKRALAVFWYAVANHIESPSYTKTTQILKHITEDSLLIKTKRYNDALYLIGILSAKRSPETTKNCLEKLSEVNYDDNIWDVNTKKYLSNKEAIEKLEEMLKS